MNVRVFDSSGNVALLCGGLLVLVRFLPLASLCTDLP